MSSDGAGPAPIARARPGAGGPRGQGSPRPDVQRNRERILAAARTVFARRGFDATLDDVAREAGLGIATVYRHFRSKAELAEAVFRCAFEQLVTDAEAAEALEDPWESLVAFLAVFIGSQAGNCAMRDFMSSTALRSAHASVMHLRLRPVSQRIVTRAQAAGVLRADFDNADIPVLGVMLTEVASFTRQTRPELWHRYLAMLIDGLRPSAAADPATTPPLRPGELRQAMDAWLPHHPAPPRPASTHGAQSAP